MKKLLLTAVGSVLLSMLMWSFGPGRISAQVANPTYTFINTGGASANQSYYVCMLTANTSGNSYGCNTSGNFYFNPSTNYVQLGGSLSDQIVGGNVQLQSTTGYIELSGDSGSHVVYINNQYVDTSTGLELKTPGIQVYGTNNVSGCSLTSAAGGASAGKFNSGTTGTCTVTITPGFTATNGFVCNATDITTAADVVKQSAVSTTTCTISGTTASGDVITWNAIAY